MLAATPTTRRSSSCFAATSEGGPRISRPSPPGVARRARNARRPVERLLVRRLLPVRPHELHAGLQERVLDRSSEPRAQRRERRCQRRVVPVGTAGSQPSAARFSTAATRPASRTTLRRRPSAAAVNYLNVFGVIQGITSEQIANFNFTGLLGEMGCKTPWAEDGVGDQRRCRISHANRSNSTRTSRSRRATSPARALRPFRSTATSSVWEVFGEAQIPIVQNSFIDELSLTASAIASRGTTHRATAREATTRTPTSCRLEFAPIHDIRFRGSYNRAVRAPNIQELFAPQFVGLDGSERSVRQGHHGNRLTAVSRRAWPSVSRRRRTRPASTTACSAVTRT